MSISEALSGKRRRRSEVENIIPYYLKGYVVDSADLLECIAESKESIFGCLSEEEKKGVLDLLFEKEKEAFLFWNKGDFEKIPECFWIKERIKPQYRLWDKDNREWEFSILNRDEIEVGEWETHGEILLSRVLDILLFNTPNPMQQNRGDKIWKLKLLNDILRDVYWLGVCYEDSDELYPLGKCDYILFKDGKNIQTTILGKQADMEYEGVHIVGASQQFLVDDEDYLADRMDEVSVKYLWSEKDKSFMAVLEKDLRLKKKLEDIMGIRRSSVWDDIM